MKEDIDIKTSFTAADSVPLKLLLDNDLYKSILKKKIPPIHVQFIPTNKCNLKCEFCSCSARKKNLEIDFEKAKNIIDDLSDLGCKAATITGGGEPLIYKKIGDLIDYFISRKIKVGLVTNGLPLKTIDPNVLNKLVWCRISQGDDRKFDSCYASDLHKVITNCPSVDWAFSHVVSTKPNYGVIAKLIAFANRMKFTHVRLVSDLFVPEKVDMQKIKSYVKSMNISDRIVIYQERKQYTQGRDCYICFLKPVISPDYKVYACCGVQYALEKPSRDLPDELSLGSAFKLKEIFARSHIPFDGRVCVKCYYQNYNIILEGMMKEVRHKEFV